MSTDQNNGRIAVITGASSGIGEATARALAGDGHRTELSDHITHPDSQRAAKEYLDMAIPPHDIADVIAFAVSRPQRVTLNEVLIRPTVQAT
jgi:NADP-dependent 3-hydroxy acid dehydrogenase YdfG